MPSLLQSLLGKAPIDAELDDIFKSAPKVPKVEQAPAPAVVGGKRKRNTESDNVNSADVKGEEPKKSKKKVQKVSLQVN